MSAKLSRVTLIALAIAFTWGVAEPPALAQAPAVPRASGAPKPAAATPAPAAAMAPFTPAIPERAPQNGSELTMEHAVEGALHRNRDVIAARLEIEAAQVDRITAGLYWNPVFQYSVSNISIGQANPQDDKHLQPGTLSQLVHTLAVSEVIDVWAKRQARIRAADLGIEQRRLRIEDALREIVYVVRGAFLDVVREQLENELRRDMKKHHDETVRLSRARVAAGEIAPFEGQKIELEGLKYQNALIDSELGLDLARERLAALLGLPTAAQLPGAAVVTATPRTPPTLAPLVARALEDRPDLRAAKKGQIVTDAMISAAQREAYPDISVGLAYTHSEFTASGDNANALGLSVSLPLPIFDKNQAGIARSRLEHKRAENDTARLNLVIQHEVADAVRRLERSGTLLDVYEGGGMLSRADNALRVAESSYKAGAVSLLELLEAQRTYIETRVQYLEVQDDYRKATIEVTHAVGERNP